MAADESAELTRILDPEGRAVPLVGNGIAVSQPLAARLGVRTGDLVELAITEARRPIVLLPVVAVAQDYAGATVQMSRAALNRIMGEGDVVSGANLLVIPDERRRFYSAVAQAPQIVAAGSRDDTVAMFRSAIAAALEVEMLFFFGFAGAIAFGIAYNITRISLTDRARDLATLRVLGFSPVECVYILCGELLLLSVIAWPFGVFGGLGLAHVLQRAFTKQDFYIPFTITPGGLGRAFAIYGAAVLAAALLVAPRVWRFDLVEVLKTRE
jgi:putative ABC transport system permease protein